MRLLPINKIKRNKFLKEYYCQVNICKTKRKYGLNTADKAYKQLMYDYITQLYHYHLYKNAINIIIFVYNIIIPIIFIPIYMNIDKFDCDKQYIISLFNSNVKNKEICVDNQNKAHCGKEGYWLETQMGIKHNSKNEPDINGYEMKKSSTKTTLGDFSASEYIFTNKRTFINEYNKWNDDIKISKKDFIHYFGTPNPKKNNRYSWSGSCVPTYNNWNSCGQNLLVSLNNDICIYYSFEKDTREVKYTFPEFLKTENMVIIAIWKEDKLRPNIDNKFNNKGFFICKKKDNKYDRICFGKPFNFEYFIECIKNKKIIFDSGMYDGNSRNYSQFRGGCFWNELIIEEY